MFKTDNATLNFVEAGKGNITLVFLHYFGGSSQSWTDVIAELKNDFHCVAIDLCGFGNSPAPLKELSLNENVKQIIKLILHLKIKRYVLIGHSMGGKLALSLASTDHSNLISLILIAPSPPSPEPMSAKSRKELANAFGDRSAIEKLIKKITKKALANSLFEVTVQDHLNASYLAWNNWVENGSREDISFLMQKITVPLLIISGESDPNFSTKFLKREFIKYFPAATFEEIKECGHLIPIEAPLEVSQSIRKFNSDL